MFLALSPGAFNRAWVAVRKSRVIVSWQVSQLSEPTNSAPGMLGGARIARSVVLQESRITLSAAPPPTTHQSFSGLPRTHRVNLVYHTLRTLNRSLLDWLRIFTGKIPGGNFMKFALLGAVSAWRAPVPLGARQLGIQWETSQKIS